ncbi:hypothetical protein AOQ84DRAFT_372307 [Glonium stellatum]|uniref:Heterokaryon incompatibility domain-containing protein n=1 Tax=Glonium stellatum TaxID=574774 RepID=A0A8E2FB97_9PEZI|nr:hypothetical protein AOQ84DRAFT_372307 [Glonium stellatum]
MGEIFRPAAKVIVYLGDGINRYDARGTINKAGNFASIAHRIDFFDDHRDLPKLDIFIQGPWKREMTDPDREPKAIHSSAFDAFCLIRMLAHSEHIADIAVFTKEISPKVEDDHRMDLFETLRRFVHAPWTPWWDRVWVIQEVVIPREVTVVYGMMSAPWTMFARAASKYARHAHSCCSKAIESLPRDYSKVLADFSQRVLDIDELRAAYLNQRTASGRLQNFEQAPTPSGVLCDNQRAEQRSLLSLLRRFRARKATDPRDKVYALLSLVQYGEGQSPMVPDYLLSEFEVFKQAALESIHSTGSLSVLIADLGRKFRQDLPTWVPDWDAPGDFSQRAWIDAVELYNASAGQRATVTNIGSKILRVEGIYLDHIAHLGDVMWADSSKSSRDTLLQWCEAIPRAGRQLTDHPGRPPPDRMPWSLLCADVIHSLSGTTDLRRFRRTEAGDELMSLTWALNAERSPFREAKNDLLEDTLLSSDRTEWEHLLNFEKSVLENDHLTAGELFQTLMPSKDQQLIIIEETAREYIGPPYFWKMEELMGRCPYFGKSRGVMERCPYFEVFKPRILGLRRLIEGTEASREEIEARIRKIEALREEMQALRGELQPLEQMDQQPLKQEHRNVWVNLLWREIHKRVKIQLLRRFNNNSELKSLPTKLQIALIDNSIMSATLNRRLFISHDGYIGLGPASTREGDELYLIKGGRTPFVLRRNTRRHYELVGDCYAHGLMDFNSENIHPHSGGRERWRDVCLV